MVEWFSVDNKAAIPNFPWQQIYALGNLDGKVPIVRYAAARDNLPGGHTESGESLNETLRREIQEELNMEVLEWQPLGYQKLTAPNKTVDYQFRAYAKLKKLGEFAGDVGGSVIAYDLVDIDEVNTRIEHGDVGALMVKLVKEIMQNSNERKTCQKKLS